MTPLEFGLTRAHIYGVCAQRVAAAVVTVTVVTSNSHIQCYRAPLLPLECPWSALECPWSSHCRWGWAPTSGSLAALPSPGKAGRCCLLPAARCPLPAGPSPRLRPRGGLEGGQVGVLTSFSQLSAPKLPLLQVQPAVSLRSTRWHEYEKPVYCQNH